MIAKVPTQQIPSTRNRSEIKNLESMSKSKWKKQVKEKIGKPEERTKQEMKNKAEARTQTIAENKRVSKKYLDTEM